MSRNKHRKGRNLPSGVWIVIVVNAYALFYGIALVVAAFTSPFTPVSLPRVFRCYLDIMYILLSLFLTLVVKDGWYIGLTFIALVHVLCVSNVIGMLHIATFDCLTAILIAGILEVMENKSAAISTVVVITSFLMILKHTIEYRHLKSLHIRTRRAQTAGPTAAQPSSLLSSFLEDLRACLCWDGESDEGQNPPGEGGNPLPGGVDNQVLVDIGTDGGNPLLGGVDNQLVVEIGGEIANPLPGGGVDNQVVVDIDEEGGNSLPRGGVDNQPVVHIGGEGGNPVPGGEVDNQLVVEIGRESGNPLPGGGVDNQVVVDIDEEGGNSLPGGRVDNQVLVDIGGEGATRCPEVE